MKAWKKWTGVLIVGMLAVLAGCSSSSAPAKKNKIVRINIGSDISTFDPRKARDLSSITVMKMLYDGLTRLEKDGNVAMSIAERYEISEDLQTYTFFLRDAKWSNGTAITAQDFADSWKKVLDPMFPSDNAFQLYAIKNAKLAKEGSVSLDEVGVFAKDEHTLIVKLETPTPFFLKLITHPVFFAVSSNVETQDMTKLAFSGPFVITEWKSQDVIKLSRNVEYWDSKVVKLDGIEMVMVSKEDTELMMYEKGDLDWAGSPISTLPIETLGDLLQKKQLITEPVLGTYFLRVNIEKAPFDHPGFRRAFALAIQRKDIIEHVIRGGQQMALSLVPPVLKLPHSNVLQDGDIAQARALFDEACEDCDYTEENFPEIVYTYMSGERSQLIAQAIQQQWMQAFGVVVKLEAIEKKVCFARLSKQDYQLAAGTWIADFDDPTNFLDVFKYKTSSTNNTNWQNDDYITLIENASQTIDPEKRLELLGKAEEVLMKELPIIPIFHSTMLYVKNDKIVDVVLSSLGCLDFKWADIQDKQIVSIEKK